MYWFKNGELQFRVVAADAARRESERQFLERHRLLIAEDPEASAAVVQTSAQAGCSDGGSREGHAHDK